MVTTEVLANLVLLGIGGYVNFGAVARTRQRDPDSGCPGRSTTPALRCPACGP
ncbi:hypothetical protein OG921_03935 [Aldersonia sp. NBC_00410]|uniref:hypothetical protein n=1 Tax=Aldersonia sp. NBC_00410 TaxID=2975954 RepID=UPI002250E9B4|nr:hypothetical protein [Aldersonia sp. NBC_00410]MCX5042338.1 hypothetical protein [Aldersonia sp. NBC_00410]